MKFLVSIGLLLILINCSKQEQKTTGKPVDTAAMPAPVGLPDTANQRQRPDGNPVQAAAWRYEKTVDKTGSLVYKASLTASNLLQFAYPYTGRSTATLTLRTGNGDTHAYIDVSNGQFNRSFQSGSARVRFDDKPPVTYTLSAAANGRANIVFFDSERSLIKRIRAARTVSMSVEFPGQRVQNIEFRTAGLRWNH